ncbi:MAG: hypothetical protein NTV34_07890 [Proteobacteria bacterium]|nr:hypothetical protein [Pseudomonadota bacterium]
MTIITLSILASCATSGIVNSSVGDRTLVISTLDLFAQTDSPRNGKNWTGDWEFRRDRLEMIDNALRDLRPDITVFQNSMKRVGSVSESDELILKAGALPRYEWQDAPIQQLPDSGEERSLAVAVLRPGTVVFSAKSDTQTYWPLGADGHVAIFVISNFGTPITLINILMPSRRDQLGLWTSFVKDRISEIIDSKFACPERTIVAGFLPEEIYSQSASERNLSTLLKDTSIGFCQNAVRCQTGTMSNEIFAVTRPDADGGQLDRILVHPPLSNRKANQKFKLKL